MRPIERRKADHIEVVLKEQVTPEHNFWDDVHLVHDALPGVDLEAVDASVVFLGKRLAFPLIVTAITGGFPEARKINRNLASACANVGIGLGVGSQRAGLEKVEEGSYSILKDYDVPLRIGNVGAPQLIRQGRKRAYTIDDMRKAQDMVEADVMAIHLNYLQEVVQPKGDTAAEGCLERIREMAHEIPCLVKETGAGISNEVAKRLKGTGIVALDVSGTGGTSFAAVEMHRAKRQGDLSLQDMGEVFFDWGIPAPVCVLEAQVGLPIIASGGVRNGLDVARGLVLGASCAGMARGILEDAMVSSKRVERRLLQVKRELQAAMFLLGAKDVKALTNKRYIVTGITRQWMKAKKGE